LAEIVERLPDRNAAIVATYLTGGYSYQKIAEHFGIHFTSVGRLFGKEKSDASESKCYTWAALPAYENVF
jgi:transposase